MWMAGYSLPTVQLEVMFTQHCIAGPPVHDVAKEGLFSTTLRTSGDRELKLRSGQLKVRIENIDRMNCANFTFHAFEFMQVCTIRKPKKNVSKSQLSVVHTYKVI